ncbi:MAG TPA: GNAT family N-acetyltransferase [Thermomicrobiales bacterium]|jgi:predicted acetyltransferase|nr:GNAT family N-acetyltransferase [Thermomicrobiales bacterium]
MSDPMPDPAPAPQVPANRPSPEPVTFGPIRDDADRRRYAALCEYAFWDEPAAEPDISWVTNDGPGIIRLARRGDRVVGGAVVTPAGQWFGGRCVPSALIGGVAVAPEDRGGGAGTAMVADYLRAARDAGCAISALYPATYGLYRRTGYGEAGDMIRHELSTAALAGARPSVDGTTVREHDGDETLLRDLYRRYAARSAGLLERLDQHWSGRIRATGTQALHAFVAERDGEAVGYVTFTQRREPAGRLADIRDFVPLDRGAARALLAFFGGHQHNLARIQFWGSPNDPRLLDEHQTGRRVVGTEPWMLRIVNLPAALVRRGYNPVVTTTLHLDHHDDLMPDNTGRWIVRVADGRATVERGGGGTIRTSSRGLSTIYGGGYRATDVVDGAHLAATADALARLDLVFTGPAPWIANHF